MRVHESGTVAPLPMRATPAPRHPSHAGRWHCFTRPSLSQCPADPHQLFYNYDGSSPRNHRSPLVTAHVKVSQGDVGQARLAAHGDHEARSHQVPWGLSCGSDWIRPAKVSSLKAPPHSLCLKPTGQDLAIPSPIGIGRLKDRDFWVTSDYPRGPPAPSTGIADARFSKVGAGVCHPCTVPLTRGWHPNQDPGVQMRLPKKISNSSLTHTCNVHNNNNNTCDEHNNPGHSRYHPWGSISAPGARRASFFLPFPSRACFCPPSSNNLEYLLAVSKKLAHPLHPVYDDGKGGGWKWWE